MSAPSKIRRKRRWPYVLLSLALIFIIGGVWAWFALDMSTMWGCSILFGALAAFVFHCSVPVVYMILMSDEIIKIPITWRRYKSYKWLKDVTREEL